MRNHRHPERSEGSRNTKRRILRSFAVCAAQDDGLRRVAILALLLLTGCSFFSKSKSRIFSLDVIPPAGAVAAARGVPVGIDSLELPPGFDRKEIVVRKANQQLDVRGTDQWSATLSDLVLHTLAFDLARRLPEGSVILPGEAKPAAMRGISVAIENIAAGPDPRVHLDAHWMLRGGATRREELAVDIPSLDSANVATGTSQALAALADRIAAVRVFALLLALPLAAAVQSYHIAYSTPNGIFVDGKRLTDDREAIVTEGAWSPDGTKILFYALRKGDAPSKLPFHFPLYVVDADGTNVQKLADAVLPLARWSPDGKRILYLSAGGLYVLADGKSERIAADVTSASWSPDGARIAYASRGEIYVDGRPLTNLGMKARNPVWSPDGQRIAFIGDGWFVMDADGAHKKRVDRFAPLALQWSPDGKRILVNAHAAAYVYTLDGAKSSAIGSGYGPIADAVFSPDGRRVLFRSRRKIYSANADGTDLRTIRDDGRSFAVSPRLP
jgi:Tol biopolymer transport system component/uncharacterized lipoprotein YmbA